MVKLTMLGVDLSNYVLLEANDDHQNLIAALDRLTLKRAGKVLKTSLMQESPSRLIDPEHAKTLYEVLKGRADGGSLAPQGFLGYLTSEEALYVLNWLDSTQNPIYFMEFLRKLKSGKAFDGNGRKIREPRLNKALDEIVGVRAPWRAEFMGAEFDNAFDDAKDNYVITYNEFDSSGKIVRVEEPLDKDTLMKNKTPGIDLEDWLNNPTSQGLPKNAVKDGSLYYWRPREGKVAGFYAGAGGSGLNCDRDRLGSGAVFGVREVHVLEK